MHQNEFWQDYSLCGTPLENGGYDSNLDNPEEGAPTLVGAACVWFYRFNESGEIEVLFQHRSEHVSRNAGKWDVSAAGHINYGETIAEAMVREAREEIGAKITEEELQYIFSVRSTNGKNLINHYLLCDRTGKDDDFDFSDQEVSEVKWVPFSQFDSFVDENVKDAIRKNVFTRGMSKVWLEKMREQRRK